MDYSTRDYSRGRVRDTAEGFQGGGIFGSMKKSASFLEKSRLGLDKSSRGQSFTSNLSKQPTGDMSMRGISGGLDAAQKGAERREVRPG